MRQKCDVPLPSVRNHQRCSFEKTRTRNTCVLQGWTKKLSRALQRPGDNDDERTAIKLDDLVRGVEKRCGISNPAMPNHKRHKKTEIPYKKDWHHNLVKTTENPETQFLYMHATSPLRRKIGAPFFARHEPKTTIQVP